MKPLASSGSLHMTISVVIPAYNSAATIRATLDSVLAQTARPDEILVMDDGSTDSTASLLDAYKPHVTLFRQANKGLSGARNGLVEKACSDLVAFLDSDDLWHPKYLETQLGLFTRYPQAAGFFASHVTFSADSFSDWNAVHSDIHSSIEVMSPLCFLDRYAATPGPFLPSFCCVPKRVLNRMGSEPFKLRIAEDVYFCNLLALEGSVVYCPIPLGAYRIREGSLSSNRLILNEGEVRAFEILESHYKNVPDANLSRAFGKAFAVKRRLYAKTLMGAGKTAEARAQLTRSLRNFVRPWSMTKSLALLWLIHMPAALQPKWPSSHRQWKSSPLP